MQNAINSLPTDNEILPMVGGNKVPALLQGQTLGKYRVLEPLGRGGMARVYRAYHPHLERYVAIKVMRSELAEDPEFLARFRREAQAVASLRHANIVHVFDFDVENDMYFMVMELLEGDTLKTRLNDYRVRGERMGWGEIVRVLLDVLAGLAYAHSEGMIHRDIKPANILLTRRGQAVLSDFGIAQIVGGTQYTASGALMGTVEYMAPEQGLEGRSDARSDIYSLGIVLYEMLTQQTPFGGDTPLGVLMKHVNDPLPLPGAQAPDIPEPLERVVFKALAKHPEDRYQSAEAMLRGLLTAAEEAEIALPDQISLPLSFTTEAAPEQAVAVLSGTARERVTDAGFATDETDVTLDKPSATVHFEKTHLLARPDMQPYKHPSVLRSILLVLGLNAGVNLIALTTSLLSGHWAIFERGWPLEFFLISCSLCLIMLLHKFIWLLIPTIIIFGNGLLLSLTALTGWWELWNTLWVFEIWLVVLAIGLAVALKRHTPTQRAVLSQRIGLWLGGVAWLLCLIIPALAIISYMLSGVLHFFIGL